MATFSILIQKGDKRKDGRYPIYIRVYWKSKSANIHTELYATPKQLTKNLQLKDASILKEVTSRIAHYEKLKLDLGFYIQEYTAKDLVAYFIQRTTTPKEGISLTEYASSYIKKLIADGRIGTADTMKSAINSICRFTKSNNIFFSSITVKFLMDYERWLTDAGLRRGVILYLCCIQTLFNRARDEYNDEDRGYIQITNYPFRKYKIPRKLIKPTKKRALTKEQIISIKNYKPTGIRDKLSRDMFMLSFYLVGMNSGDMHKCPKQERGRITYNRAKTMNQRNDNAKISIKIEKEAQQIIDEYSGSEQLLNVKEKYAKPKSFNIVINKGLKIIGNHKKVNIPNLTFYAARHSWATIAINECNISKDDVHTALNHIDERMKITDIYIRKDWSRIDRANRAVIDFVLG